MLNERLQQVGLVLKGSGMQSSPYGEFLGIEYGQVGERVHLEISPQIFDRIQLRRVRRQEDTTNMTMGEEKFAHHGGSVGLQTVPHQHEGRSKLTIQLDEKRHGPLRIDIGIAMQAKIQLNMVTGRRNAQGTDDAHLLMRTGPLVEDWSMATRCPTAPHQGRHQQPRFVNKDQPGIQTRGVFFTPGQVLLTQFAIACSSRSTALRAGFCGLQPRARIKRPMWST